MSLHFALFVERGVDFVWKLVKPVKSVAHKKSLTGKLNYISELEIFSLKESKMFPQLTTGALSKICQGQEITDPVLQVLGHKPILGSGQERSAEK